MAAESSAMIKAFFAELRREKDERGRRVAAWSEGGPKK